LSVELVLSIASFQTIKPLRISLGCSPRVSQILSEEKSRPTDGPALVWDGVITSSSNLTGLRNEATAPRNGQEFQRSRLTELAITDFESWAKESYEIAKKFAYRNGEWIGVPRRGAMDCTMVAAAPVLPVDYVVSASWIAERRMILTGYRLAELMQRMV
jgi:hypothetical protein